MKKNLQLTGVIPDALPVLAEAGNAIPLQEPHVPQYFQEAAQQYLSAVRDGARLVLFDLRQTRPARQTQADRYPSAEAILSPDADFFQLLHRGLLQADESKGFTSVSPDDRTARSSFDIGDKVKPQYRQFEQRVIRAEEAGSPFFGQDEKGKVVVLTHETAGMFEGDLARLNSKMGRVFPPETVKKIVVPEAGIPNLYQQWTKELLQAETGTFQHLFLRAGANPQTIRRAPERANRALPGSLGFAVQPEQEQAFQTILRLFQAQMWSRLSVLLYGDYARGKTTLMTAQAQLLSQLGRKVGYYSIGQSNRDLRFDHDPDVTCIDQIDQLDQRGFSPHSEMHQYVMTSNRKPTDMDSLRQAADLGTGDSLPEKLPSTFSEFQKAVFAVRFPGTSWSSEQSLV